jgi:hypothetical protein
MPEMARLHDLRTPTPSSNGQPLRAELRQASPPKSSRRFDLERDSAFICGDISTAHYT